MIKWEALRPGEFHVRSPWRCLRLSHAGNAAIQRPGGLLLYMLLIQQSFAHSSQQQRQLGKEHLDTDSSTIAPSTSRHRLLCYRLPRYIPSAPELLVSTPLRQLRHIAQIHANIPHTPCSGSLRQCGDHDLFQPGGGAPVAILQDAQECQECPGFERGESISINAVILGRLPGLISSLAASSCTSISKTLKWPWGWPIIVERCLSLSFYVHYFLALKYTFAWAVSLTRRCEYFSFMSAGIAIPLLGLLKTPRSIWTASVCRVMLLAVKNEVGLWMALHSKVTTALEQIIGTAVFRALESRYNTFR